MQFEGEVIEGEETERKERGQKVFKSSSMKERGGRTFSFLHPPPPIETRVLKDFPLCFFVQVKK